MWLFDVSSGRGPFASCFSSKPFDEILPPVDLRAVCLVRAMVMFYRELRGHGSGSRLMVMDLEDLWQE